MDKSRINYLELLVEGREIYSSIVDDVNEILNIHLPPYRYIKNSGFSQVKYKLIYITLAMAKRYIEEGKNIKQVNEKEPIRKLII